MLLRRFRNRRRTRARVGHARNCYAVVGLCPRARCRAGSRRRHLAGCCCAGLGRAALIGRYDYHAAGAGRRGQCGTGRARRLRRLERTGRNRVRSVRAGDARPRISSGLLFAATIRRYRGTVRARRRCCRRRGSGGRRSGRRRRNRRGRGDRRRSGRRRARRCGLRAGGRLGRLRLGRCTRCTALGRNRLASVRRTRGAHFRLHRHGLVVTRDVVAVDVDAIAEFGLSAVDLYDALAALLERHQDDAALGVEVQEVGHLGGVVGAPGVEVAVLGRTPHLLGERTTVLVIPHHLERLRTALIVGDGGAVTNDGLPGEVVTPAGPFLDLVPRDAAVVGAHAVDAADVPLRVVLLDTLHELSPGAEESAVGEQLGDAGHLREVGGVGRHLELARVVDIDHLVAVEDDLRLSLGDERSRCLRAGVLATGHQHECQQRCDHQSGDRCSAPWRAAFVIRLHVSSNLGPAARDLVVPLAAVLPQVGNSTGHPSIERLHCAIPKEKS